MDQDTVADANYGTSGDENGEPRLAVLEGQSVDDIHIKHPLQWT